MNTDYDRQFQVGKLISIAQFIPVAALIVITELMLNGTIGLDISGEASPLETYPVIKFIFYGVSAVFLLLAFFMKRTIRTLNEGIMLSFLKGMIRSIKRGGSGSALSLLIPPSALCEMVVLLGFILYILSPGPRTDCYPLYAAGLAMMLYIFPNEDEKENLIKMNNFP